MGRRVSFDDAIVHALRRLVRAGQTILLWVGEHGRTNPQARLRECTRDPRSASFVMVVLVVVHPNHDIRAEGLGTDLGPK